MNNVNFESNIEIGNIIIMGEYYYKVINKSNDGCFVVNLRYDKYITLGEYILDSSDIKMINTFELKEAI